MDGVTNPPLGYFPPSPPSPLCLCSFPPSPLTLAPDDLGQILFLTQPRSRPDYPRVDDLTLGGNVASPNPILFARG